ncbi:MAG: hypothetical protein ACI9PU_002369 [Ascidiaceihabitans sp.]|jgi:hypothetical protein
MSSTARQAHLKDAAGRRQKALTVPIPYRDSSGPLHLLMGSTGIKAEGEGEWDACKHSSHTCKHVLPGKGWPKAPPLAHDPHSLPSRVLRSNVPRGGVDIGDVGQPNRIWCLTVELLFQQIWPFSADCFAIACPLPAAHTQYV